MYSITRDAKKPISIPLCITFSLCMLAACLPGHGRPTKLALLLSLTWIAYYLITETNTGDPTADLGLGSALLTQILSALDAMYFTDPNTLVNRHAPRPSGPITDQPLRDRTRWAFNLYTNARGIGWAHEPPDLPRAPSRSTSRRTFVATRLLSACACALVEFLAYVLLASNPAMNTPGRLVSQAPFGWRVLGVVAFGAAGAARICAASSLVSAGMVGLGFSSPDRWPSLFGSPLEAWSVRRFWRKVWHQMLRKNLLAATYFILVDILHLPPLSPNPTFPSSTKITLLHTAHKALFVNTAFLISGLVHIGGEYMLLGRVGFGALRFFCLQGAGVALEMGAGAAWVWVVRVRYVKADGRAVHGVNGVKKANGEGVTGNGLNGLKDLNKQISIPRPQSKPPVWIRCVGYAWTASWFAYSAVYMIDPLLRFDMFVDPRFDLRVNGWVI